MGLANRLVVMLACLLADTAQESLAASVFRCQAKGRVVYQDRPCAAGEAVRDFDSDPPTVSVIPFATPPPAPLPPRVEKPRPARQTSRTGGRQATTAHSDAQVAERRHVREGMGDGEVLARLGPPDLKSGGGRGGASWTYLPAPADPQTVTVVRFDRGRVSVVERKIAR